MEKKKVTLVIFLFICYFALLIPYIVHTNLSEVNVGIVINLKTTPVQALPNDIRDVVFSEKCTVLLLEDGISGTKTVVVTEKSSSYIHKGDVMVVTDKIIDWYVDWHAYKEFFFDDSFNSLIVGEAERVNTVESFIEEMLFSSFGSPIFSLSKVIFLLAPILLILYVSFSFKRRFYLWNILAILALYSLEVFISNIVGSMHDIVISDTWKYFGYSFLILVLFTFFFGRYEESEEGQKKIKEYYDKIEGLFTRFFG